MTDKISCELTNALPPTQEELNGGYEIYLAPTNKAKKKTGTQDFMHRDLDEIQSLCNTITIRKI